MSEAISLGMESNPLEGIKSFKANAKLHKPIENVSLLLEETKLIIFSVAAQNHIALAILNAFGGVLRRFLSCFNKAGTLLF